MVAVDIERQPSIVTELFDLRTRKVKRESWITIGIFLVLAVACLIPMIYFSTRTPTVNAEFIVCICLLGGILLVLFLMIPFFMM
jgi:uncharacterized membrane protein